MNTIAPKPGILDIALYQGGSAQIEGVDQPVKLSSNENPFGPSPKVRDAITETLGSLHRYPSTDHDSLRQTIAKVHGLEADRIICGVGSDEIISLLCNAYAGAGDEVVHTEHGFAMYSISAKAAGATPVVASETERHTDVDALLDACSERTKLVFIANPNNPTGTMIGGNEIARLAAGIPQQAILVLDGAYAEYVPDFDGHAALAKDRSNIVMTRTFSKLYGLGGLRIGWAYGPQPIIDVLHRVRGPFNLSHTQLAAAEAAMRDQDYAAECLAENTRLREILANALRDIGIASDPSYANFILARFSDETEAASADAHLKQDGLIVRRVTSYGFPHGLRITVGDEASCTRVIKSLRRFMGHSE